MSDRDALPLSALEDGHIAAPREAVVPRKKKDVRHRFATPMGVNISIVDRGTRGWFLDHRPPWSETAVRSLLTKGSRDEAVRLASTTVDELYKTHAQSPTPTLLTVAAELLVAKRREGRADGYTRKLEEHLRGYIAPAFGADTPVGAITAKDVLEFKRNLGCSDLEPESCNRILTTLRQILKHAEDPGGYISAPPLPRNFRSAQWKTRERWQILEPSEIARMLELAPDEIRPVLGYVANTGLRIGTALATEASWIDFANRRVTYPASAMKGRHRHVVDLGVAAEQFLRQGLHHTPERPFAMGYWTVLKAWTKVREALGRPTLRIHDLRHSFISNQLAAGTPVHVVQQLAAHRSLAVTALYAHATDEARKAASERVQIGAASPPDATPPAATPPAVTPAPKKPALRLVR